VALLDASVASPADINQHRDSTSDAANASDNGTLLLRRRVVNQTGASVTRLRFRVIEITTFTSAPLPGQADIRVRTSTTGSVANVKDSATCFASTGSATTPCTVTVQGLTREQPPTQPNNVGGGWNSTLSAGTVTLGTPLANGASINVNFLLGVKQPGNFRFYIVVEALP
jgi:hypothetical protein